MLGHDSKMVVRFRKQGSKREDAEANEDGSEQKIWGTQGLLIKLKKRRWAKIFRNECGPGLACLELVCRARTNAHAARYRFSTSNESGTRCQQRARLSALAAAVVQGYVWIDRRGVLNVIASTDTKRLLIGPAQESRSKVGANKGQ